jgi:hypothetical protein
VSAAEDVFFQSFITSDYLSGNGKKTFKQVKQFGNAGTKRGNLNNTVKASMKATLGGFGDLKKSVQLPDGEDLNEWLAVNSKSI